MLIFVRDYNKYLTFSTESYTFSFYSFNNVFFYLKFYYSNVARLTPVMAYTVWDVQYFLMCQVLLTCTYKNHTVQ